MEMIDQLMRDAVEQNRPPSAPNLAIILAKGRVRRRRVRIAQAGAAVLTVSTAAGAVAIGQTLQPDRDGPPTTSGSSPAPASSPTPANRAEPTEAPPPRSSSTPSATAEEPLDPAVGPLDWDGGRWDVGNVVSINREADRLVVILDRYQMYQSESGSDEFTLRAGKRLISEPFVVGNSDTPFVNESSKLRSYVLAADAKVQWISNVDQICASLQGGGDNAGVGGFRQKPAPKFERWDVDRLVADSMDTEDLNGSGAKYDGRQDVLTFNDSGQVVRLVFSHGC